MQLGEAVKKIRVQITLREVVAGKETKTKTFSVYGDYLEVVEAAVKQAIATDSAQFNNNKKS